MTNALVSVEQKQVRFYEDEITAIRTNDNHIYIPVRPICDLLGVDWASQYRRLNRDPVLRDELSALSLRQRTRVTTQCNGR